MPGLIDLTGQIFGRLTVVGRSEDRLYEGRGYARWTCRCSCGATVDVDGNFLRRGNTKSCGCYRNEVLRRKRTADGEPARNALIKNYSARAKRKGLGWSLTTEEATRLFSSPCVYCGQAPLQVYRTGNGSEFKYNGLDRVNNDLGYTPQNAVPCCGICNRAKGTLTPDEFRDWAERLKSHWLRP